MAPKTEPSAVHCVRQKWKLFLHYWSSLITCI